jgi:hypothetical protein
MNNFFYKGNGSKRTKKRKINEEAFPFQEEDQRPEQLLLLPSLQQALESSSSIGAIEKEKESESSKGFNNLKALDSEDEDTVFISPNSGKIDRVSQSSGNFLNSSQNSFVSPTSLRNLRLFDPTESPMSRSQKGGLRKVYSLSSTAYPGQQTQIPMPLGKPFTNRSILETFLQVEEEIFDPLCFSLPPSLGEEITERQKEIASDWPLAVVPPPFSSKDTEKEIRERCLVQAQISNGAQMIIKMLLQGDIAVAMQFAMDIYALSTRAVTLLNRERVNILIPNSKFALDLENVEVLTPAIKELLASYRSFAAIQNFFQAGGERSPSLPPSYRIKPTTPSQIPSTSNHQRSKVQKKRINSSKHSSTGFKVYYQTSSEPQTFQEDSGDRTTSGEGEAPIPTGGARAIGDRFPPNRREDKGLLPSVGEDVWWKRVCREGSNLILEERKEGETRKRKRFISGNKTGKERERGFWKSSSGRVERENSGTDKEEGRQLVEPIIRRAKTSIDEIQKDLRLQEIKRMSRDEILQDGRLNVGSRYNHQRRLGHVGGSHQCLQSLGGASGSKRFFSFPISREDLCIQSDAIWAFTKPFLLHQVNEVSSDIHQRALEGSYSNLHGRHSYSSSGQDVPTGEYFSDSGLSSILGPDSELREVRIESQTRHRISRMEMEPPLRGGYNDKGEESGDGSSLQTLGTCLCKQENSQDKEVCKLSRVPEFPAVTVSSCESIYEKSLQYLDSSTEESESELDRESSTSDQQQSRDKMVETEYFTKRSISASQVNVSGSHIDNRRLKDRMGRRSESSGRTIYHVRPIFSRDKSPVLKLQGDHGGLIGPKVFSFDSKQKGDKVFVDSYRQPDDGSHSEENKGKTAIAATSKEDLLFVDKEKDSNNSTTSPRNRERECGLVEQVGSSRRLSVRQRRLPKRFKNFTGFPDSRLFLDNSQSSSSSLCNSDTMRFSDDNRCVQLQLGGGDTLSPSSNSSNYEVSENNNSGQGTGSYSDPGLARSTVMAVVNSTHSKESSSRGKFSSVVSRFSVEEDESQAPTREDDYVSHFLETISPEFFRVAMKWILDIVSCRTLDMRVIIRYLQSFGKEALRRKLRGYVIFQKYCSSKNISIQMILNQDPIKLLTDFILSLQQMGLSEYVIADSRHAISTFLEDMLGKSGVSKNKLVSTLVIPRYLHVPRKARYSEAWDISLLFAYYRSRPPNNSLNDYDVMIKAVILILVFTACRPREVVNILADKIQHIAISKSLLIPTVVKSHRNTITNLQVQSLPDVQICPVSAISEWLERKKKFLNPSVFLYTQSGNPLRYAQLLSPPIRTVLTAAGVPPQFRPYSIKHAVISALFHLGCSRAEVNLFTGHSELADTAPAFYLKSIHRWPGFLLAEAPLGSPEALPTSGSLERK